MAQREAAEVKDIEPKGAFNEDRYWSIVDAASEVFVQKGYRNATVQDVAERVGLLKGSLYYYIKSKEDLLYAVIDRSHRRAKESLDAAEGLTSSDPAERLRRFIEVWTDNIESQFAVSRLTNLEARYLSRESRDKLRSLEREVEAVLSGIIADGAAQGVFDSEVDNRLAVLTIFHLLHRPRSRAGDAGFRKRVRDWNTEFILRGLGWTAEKSRGA